MMDFTWATQNTKKFPPPHEFPQARRRHGIGFGEHFERGSPRLRYSIVKCRPMSGLGQKQTCAVRQPKSALPPIATLTAFFGSSAFGNSGHLRSKADVIGYNLATSVVCFRVG
jgi:hypothetical protein